MASDELISAYRAELAHRLPPAVLDELVDGLVETRDAYLKRGPAPEFVTTAAIVEFGQPDTVVAAFTRNVPGRRYAVRLLATGPVFAPLWGAALITTSAWAWPIPRLVEIAYGTALLAAVNFAAPTLSWTMAPAIAASLLRIVTVTPRLPTLLTYARFPAGSLG